MLILPSGAERDLKQAGPGLPVLNPKRTLTADKLPDGWTDQPVTADAVEFGRFAFPALVISASYRDVQ
jgi:hypothetical protein